MKIRSMGTDVELIEPEWLREQLKQDAILNYQTYVEGKSIEGKSIEGKSIEGKSIAQDLSN